MKVLFPFGLHNTVEDGCSASFNDDKETNIAGLIEYELRELECEITDKRKEVSKCNAGQPNMRKYRGGPPSFPECGYPAPLARRGVVIWWCGGVYLTDHMGVVDKKVDRGQIVIRDSIIMQVPESVGSAKRVFVIAFFRRFCCKVSA